MAKIYGLFGAMSGKVADVVMSVRNGQQIVRKYQPNISNPKTQNQFSTRARFKLLSQLSAVLAPVIAFRRRGGISSRNFFTKYNFSNTSFDLDTDLAAINLTDVDLTGGVLAFPPVSAQHSAGSLTSSVTGYMSDIDRVVFAVVQVQDDNKFRLIDTAVVSKNDAEPNVFTHKTDMQSALHGFVYAFGMRDNNETAKSRFGNIYNATTQAVLQVYSSLTDIDVTLTETSAVQFSPVGAESQTALSNSRNKKEKTADID